MRRTTYITLTLALGLFAGAGCAGNGEEAAATAGETQAVETAAVAVAPSTDFVLNDLTGGELKLADYRGEVVILDFWATWCGPCKMVMPYLQKIHEDYAEEGIRVVALSVDRKGPAVVRQFIDQSGYTFPVAMAGAELQKAYGGIRSIPTTFIIGPDGQVAEQMVGAHPMNDYLAAARRAKIPAEG